jgi:hypothetical protein
VKEAEWPKKAALDNNIVMLRINKKQASMPNLIRIIRSSFIGAISAIIYAFISFYLVSSLIRDNLYSLVFYGIHGFIFGMIFISLNILLEKNCIKSFKRHLILYNLAIGTISGAISCLPNIYFSWLGFTSTIYQPDIYVPPEIITNEKTGLILFFLGSTLLGSSLGSGIGFFSKKAHSQL